MASAAHMAGVLPLGPELHSTASKPAGESEILSAKRRVKRTRDVASGARGVVGDAIWSDLGALGLVRTFSLAAVRGSSRLENEVKVNLVYRV